jgi:hypothetical protein
MMQESRPSILLFNIIHKGMEDILEPTFEKKLVSQPNTKFNPDKLPQPPTTVDFSFYKTLQMS